MPYDLAQEHCLEFGICSSKDQAEVNEQLIKLLYIGNGALNSGSCTGLCKIGEDIVNFLFHPSYSSEEHHLGKYLTQYSEGHSGLRLVLGMFRGSHGT